MTHATTAPWRARIIRGGSTAALAFALALGVSPLAPTATADAAPATAERKAEKPAAKKAANKKAANKKKAKKKVPMHEGFRVKQMRLKPLPSRGERVLRVARAQAGDLYAWGGAGPNRFDCSGLTQYVYRKALGKSLPHSSAAQAGRTQRIGRAAARPGDLVFFHNGGSVYHVGIYAGGNSIWHAPGTGKRVTKAAIWTGSHFFGRVR